MYIQRRKTSQRTDLHATSTFGGVEMETQRRGSSSSELGGKAGVGGFRWGFEEEGIVTESTAEEQARWGLRVSPPLSAA